MTGDNIKKGFTLIELLVSISVFLIVIVSVVNLFSSAIKTQKKSLSLQMLSDSSSFAIEYMSRSIRMAKKDLFSGCNFEEISNDGIRFLNYEGEEQIFILENGQIKEDKGGASEFVPLTSDNFQVNKLSFELFGECQGDKYQPKITIAMQIQTKEADPQLLNIQTTISQRDLDVTRY